MTIIVLNKPRFRSRIALFDYDWTIVRPKDDKTFPTDIDDWQWLRPNVPDIIKDYYKKGFGIYVFTNQSKQWKKDQIVNVLRSLDIPITICIAFNQDDYKPSLTLYNEIFEKHTSKIKFDKSFMCGDAVGRKTDHSDADLKFAEAIGIKCIIPEETFPYPIVDYSIIKPSKKQEVIILVGYPGSGKSHISLNIFEPAGYFIAHGDDLKTSTKMIKAATEPLKDGKSIVFDATNASKKKRAEYVTFAKDIPIRCIHVNTSIEESLYRNNKREHPVPRIAYHIFKKHFEEPDQDEGFTILTI